MPVVLRAHLVALALVALLAAWPTPALAQGGPATPTAAVETPAPAPDRVEVEPVARDGQIRGRLESILEATGWFVRPEVRVQDGVVFLQGQTDSEEYRTWAGDLARRTQDVVAVVNRIQVTEPSIWDLRPALMGLRDLGRSGVRALPTVLFSLFILVVAWVVAQLAIAGTHAFLRPRVANALLRNVAARSIGLLVLLLGLYVVFDVAGLTSLALTLLGGTGLLGLVLGIAFRDITENFLASIFLSLQSPFRAGDLVEVAGVLGFVQVMTTRATVLMTTDGNHVQIPNATVYKANIRNYSSNPNRREDFAIGIGYDDSIAEAQELALRVLAEHPAVLKEPEPWVLVDSLGPATVNLRIYFWLDGSQYSWLTVRSSVIRLVKRAFQAEGISMPDEAREVVFPQGVPVQLLEKEGLEKETREQRQAGEAQAAEEPTVVSTDAEAGLLSDAEGLQEQARLSRTPEEGPNLLESSPEA